MKYFEMEKNRNFLQILGFQYIQLQVERDVGIYSKVKEISKLHGILEDKINFTQGIFYQTANGSLKQMLRTHIPRETTMEIKKMKIRTVETG